MRTAVFDTVLHVFYAINVMVVQHDRIGIKWHMFHMCKRL